VILPRVFGLFCVYPPPSQIVLAQPVTACPRRAPCDSCTARRSLLDGAILVVTPMPGGHHLVNVLADFPAAAIAFFAAGCCEKPAKPSDVVNEVTRLDPVRVPYRLFRASVEQKGEAQAACD